MTLYKFWKTADKSLKVFDDISGEDFCLQQINGESTPLDGDWRNLAVTATEDCGDYIAVYIAY